MCVLVVPNIYWISQVNFEVAIWSPTLYQLSWVQISTLGFSKEKADLTLNSVQIQFAAEVKCAANVLC